MSSKKKKQTKNKQTNKKKTNQMPPFSTRNKEEVKYYCTATRMRK